jgi:SIR2-like domain
MVRPDARRWLLKMHGCLSDPDGIVLTRASYTRYDERLPALGGMVHAFLVTRHVLFAGSPLADDNFHRIVDSVRRLRGEGRPAGPFGTALALRAGGLAEVLWEQDVRRVRMADQPESAAGFPAAEASRRLEVFLDYLVSRTRDAAHLPVGARVRPAADGGRAAAAGRAGRVRRRRHRGRRPGRAADGGMAAGRAAAPRARVRTRPGRRGRVTRPGRVCGSSRSRTGPLPPQALFLRSRQPNGTRGRQTGS